MSGSRPKSSERPDEVVVTFGSKQERAIAVKRWITMEKAAIVAETRQNAHAAARERRLARQQANETFFYEKLMPKIVAKATSDHKGKNVEYYKE